MKKINFSDWTFIFDFDGTLADTTMVGVDRINYICKKIKLEEGKIPDKITLRELWGLPYKDLINIIAKRFDWLDSDCENFWKEDFLYINPKPKKFASINTALNYVYDIGVNLAIISSREKESIIELAPICGINLNFFEYVQGSNCHEHIKPDPKVFDLIENYLTEKGRDIGKVVYIGDTVNADYEAAKKRGLKFVAIASSFMSTPADFVASGLDKKMIFNNPADLCINTDKIIKFYH